MSLIRAFTTRLNRPEMNVQTSAYVTRAQSQRGGKPIFRSQISSPVALVSTTNVLSYNAPSLPGTPTIGVRNLSFGSTAASSHSSGDESDGTGSSGSIHSSETLTDASSIDESSSISPEPNHLSCYFKPAIDTTSPDCTPPALSRPSFDAPNVPHRAASHSKKSHFDLSRKRSIQRMAPPNTSAEMARSSMDVSDNPYAGVEAQSTARANSSPFGNELAQLDEACEEFGHVVRDAEADADAVFMEVQGLGHFGASDYLSEISSLLADMFANEAAELGGWI